VAENNNEAEENIISLPGVIRNFGGSEEKGMCNL